MALLILALLQRIFLMSSLMLLLVWLIFFMVLIKLLPILGTISGKTVKLMVLALIRSEERRVGKECRSRGLPHRYKNKFLNYRVLLLFVSILHSFFSFTVIPFFNIYFPFSFIIHY